jgi:hypothetical protein
MSSNQQQQQAAAAAAPIPVSPARAEKDAMAAAARAGLVRRPAGSADADIEVAVRIAAALHAPPSIPVGAWQFMWAVGVTTEGQILAANSYGVGYIPDGVKLPSQVVFVSADEAIPAGERGRWVRYPFLALQGWAQFHGKTIRAIIGTKEEVEPFKGSMNTRTLVDDDIPADGTMQGRSRLEVVAPEVAARVAAWPDTELHAALPPQHVQLVAPDASAGTMLWMDALTPLTQTTGEGYRTAHLAALATYARHREALCLYEAYTAPFVAAQRAAITEWLYWGHLAAILIDAGNPVLGA